MRYYVKKFVLIFLQFINLKTKHGLYRSKIFFYMFYLLDVNVNAKKGLFLVLNGTQNAMPKNTVCSSQA